ELAVAWPPMREHLLCLAAHHPAQHVEVVYNLAHEQAAALWVKVPWTFAQDRFRPFRLQHGHDTRLPDATNAPFVEQLAYALMDSAKALALHLHQDDARRATDLDDGVAVAHVRRHRLFEQQVLARACGDAHLLDARHLRRRDDDPIHVAPRDQAFER